MIYSIEWRTYSSLATRDYTHLTVNHYQNFVDPNTGAHIKTVERLWGGCKSIIREQKSTHSNLFETYLQEYTWRKQFDTVGQDAFSLNTLQKSIHATKLTARNASYNHTCLH